MKEGGIKKSDGFLVYGIKQKLNLKFVEFFFFFVICLLLPKETGILT